METFPLEVLAGLRAMRAECIGPEQLGGQECPDAFPVKRGGKMKKIIVPVLLLQVAGSLFATGSIFSADDWTAKLKKTQEQWINTTDVKGPFSDNREAQNYETINDVDLPAVHGRKMEFFRNEGRYTALTCAPVSQIPVKSPLFLGSK